MKKYPDLETSLTMGLKTRVYGLCVTGSMVVVIAMAAADICAVRDESIIPYLQIWSIRLEYVSERIMVMKKCDDFRFGLPILLLFFYIGVLALFVENELYWQKEFALRSGILDKKKYIGVVLLVASALGLFILILYDHTGLHRRVHFVGVLLMLLGLAGVYAFTSAYESVCNLHTYVLHQGMTSGMTLCVAHVLVALLFVITIGLFVLEFICEHLQIAVLSEYFLLLLMLVMAVISIIELQAESTGFHGDCTQHSLVYT